MPYGAHVAQVLAQHQFQEALKDYHDLTFLARNLDRWKERLGVLKGEVGRANVRDRDAALARAPQEGPARNGEFNDRIAEGEQRLRAMQSRVAALLTDQQAKGDHLVIAQARIRRSVSLLASCSHGITGADNEPGDFLRGMPLASAGPLRTRDDDASPGFSRHPWLAFRRLARDECGGLRRCRPVPLRCPYLDGRPVAQLVDPLHDHRLVGGEPRLDRGLRASARAERDGSGLDGVAADAEEKVLDVVLSDEQVKVLKMVVEEGKNVFFTGSAGTFLSLPFFWVLFFPLFSSFHAKGSGLIVMLLAC